MTEYSGNERPKSNLANEMFGFVTDEDRKRWGPPAPAKGKRTMFAKMAEGLIQNGQRAANGRLQAEQTGRSINQGDRTIRRVITEKIESREVPGSGYDY